MSDLSLRSAVRVIADAKLRAPDVATKLIFDRYRTSREDTRDALVIALIGEVLTGEARRRSPPSSPSDAQSEAA